MEEKMVEKSMEVDIIECCMIDRLLSTHRTLRLTFVGLSTCISAFNQGYSSYAVITRDTEEHCETIGGEVQYGYIVSEPGTYLTLGTPTKHSHAKPLSIPILVNYFLRNVFM